MNLALALAPRAALTFPQAPPLRRLRATLSAPLQRLAPAPRMELRIDVSPSDQGIAAELDALRHRLHTPGDPFRHCTRLPVLLPGLVFHHREADGEHFVYVEDPSRSALAGYTVFNRLIEVDRHTDRHVRSPHSRYAAAYRGRGIASAVYRWGLGEGFCLVSGARQSVGAHALWHALGRRHPLGWVALRARRMLDLGSAIGTAQQGELDTRMILLGHGWSWTRLRALGLLHPTAEASDDKRV